MKAVISGILTCICCHAFAEDKSTVTIVDADIIDGVENKIVKLVWHEDMNLIEASLSGQQDSFHAVVILLSGDTATIYGGHAEVDPEIRARG